MTKTRTAITLDAEATRHQTRTLKATEELVRLALEAHLAAGLGWPHHAHWNARRTAQAARAALERLEPWTQVQPEAVEDADRANGPQVAVTTFVDRGKQPEPTP